MTAPTSILSMRSVQKRFGSTLALRSVDLELQQGQVLALIGENGAGKSTLMKVLSGAHKPDAGEMTLGGQRYQPKTPLHARRSGVAMIYQELSIAPHLTVMENILLGVEPGTGPLVSWSHMKQQAQRALSEIGRPDISPLAKAGDLGIAEQQLIEIARAIALGSRVLVLDEPTSSLTRRISPTCLRCSKVLNRRASALSISRISWKKSAKSATATPCCAMEHRSAAESPPRLPMQISSASWLAAMSATCTPEAFTHPATWCCNSITLPVPIVR